MQLVFQGPSVDAFTFYNPSLKDYEGASESADERTLAVFDPLSGHRVR